MVCPGLTNLCTEGLHNYDCACQFWASLWLPGLIDRYEPVQVFTLIWWPQRCKNSSPMIWSWWYPNQDFKNPSWSQLSDGVSCLSWWFIIFMAKNGFVSRNGKKGFFWHQLNCTVKLQKTNYPIIYFAMVECQFVLKCWGHQLHNDLAQKKVWI